MSGQNFNGDVAAEARIMRAVHFSHTAGSQRGDDFVGAEFSPGNQAHNWQKL